MSVYVAPDPPWATTPEGAAARPAGLSSRLASVLLGLALALAATVAIGAAAGYRGEVILTGSMRPALEPGDLVVADRVAARDLRAGDIVSFDDHGRTITHRVRSVRTHADGRLAIVTRGDANNVPERWDVAPDSSVGRIVAHMPKAGYLTRWTATGPTRMIVLALMAAAIAFFGLRWVWRD